MVRDPLWQQIKSAIQRQLDPTIFERCAQDLLGKIYPGLVPVVGGSDAGMDGSFPSPDGTFPLICTTGDDVLGNFRNSISNHLRRRSGPCRCILATSQALTPQRRDNIFDEAKKLDVTIHQIHEQEDFIGRLYRNSAWRLELLGVTGAPPALSVFPPAFRQVEATLLLGRESDVEWLRMVEGDALIVGQPGSGKTHLHQHMAVEDGLLFVTSGDEVALANAIREQQPKIIAVDDAHIRLEWIDRLRRLRAEISADYRIHANCWPNYADSVRNRMGVSATRIRQLHPIPRKVMNELIRAWGIWGPDQLIYLLLEQSAGRPGLCSALVQVCKQGETRRIWTGEALADRILVVGDLLRDETDREVLARIALGGDAGASIDAVATSMEMKRFELRERLTSLGVGGVIAEIRFAADRLIILPEPLRSVLLRDVFIKGPAPASLESAMPAYDDRASVASALMSAKQRGVAVPVATIRSLVFELNNPKLWEHYSWIHESTANDVLTNRPGVVTHAASGLLHHHPRRAIEALIRPESGRETMSPAEIDKLTRSISDWICEWNHEAETADRRKTLMEALDTIQTSESPLTADAVVRYLMMALDPQLRGIRPDVVDRHAINFRRGIYPEASIHAIALLWSKALRLLPHQMGRNWPRLLGCLSDWAWPGRGDVNIPPELSRFMKDSATSFMKDLLALPQCGPPLRKAIRRIALGAKLAIQIPQDDFFDLVFADRDYSSDWEKQRRERSAELETLATRLIANGSQSASQALGTIEREVAQFDDSRAGWDRMHLYRTIAGRVKDPEAWMMAFIDQQVPPSFVAPFVEVVRSASPDALRNRLPDLSDSSHYSELARCEILQDPSSSPELLDRVIKNLQPFERDNEYRFPYKRLPINVMRRLLSHERSAIRLGAALGEWQAEQSREVRPELVDVWTNAVLLTEPSDGNSITMILSERPDLAEDWASRRIQAGKHSLWQFSHEIAMFSDKLSREQRLNLAVQMNTFDRFDENVFDFLLGPDDGAFQIWITSIENDDVKVLPFRRKPSELWRRRAAIAMDSGIAPEAIADVTGEWGESWSGSQSAHFQSYLDEYEKLMLHPDLRFRVIAEKGLMWAKQRFEEARRREFLESL
jgi:hypothetical protein